MTALAPPAASTAPVLRPTARRPGDRLFRYAALFCGLLVLLILLGILVSTLNKSFPFLRFEGTKFFTKTWDPTNGKLGGLSLVYGTVVTAAIAIVVAVPVSLGIALFTTELAPRRLRSPLVFLVDLLAAVPSVVYGLWGAFVLVAPIGHFYGHISNAVSSIPVLDTLLSGSSGASYMTAGLIVALMIVPIISSLSREVFVTVPSAQKEAAFALGSTRWEMIRVSVLGYGRNGVIGAVMLGLGRAMGETIAVALTIGSVQTISGHLFHPGDALASIIANQFGESTNSFGTSGKVPFQAALIGLGLALFVLTVIVNLIARAIIARGERTLRGPEVPAPTGSVSTSTVSTARRARNLVALGLISLALLVALIPLGFVVYSLIQKGGHLFRWSFFTKPIPTPRHIGPGMGPAIAGTLIITFWATVISVPLGVMGAVYVVEYGAANRLSQFIRFMADVMAGVPSIVMGLFVFSAFTLHFKFIGIGGSLALACLMLPIVIRSTESILRLVPRDMREASQALGASRSRTILTVVLPAALPGIVSGALLAVARRGETAPLLFTIGIISAKPNWNVFSGTNTTLSAQIFSLASSSSYIGSTQRAWTAALTLIVLVLVLTVSARLITNRLSVRTS